MLTSWIKIYWYTIIKYKIYFLLTVISLAVGIASVVLSFMYYEEESSYDQWNPYKDEVYVVESKITESISWMLVPYPVGLKLKEELPYIDDYMYLGTEYFMGVIEYKGEKKQYNYGIMVQQNFFEFFPFEFIYGNRESSLKDKNNVVVSDIYAKRLFGQENPIGEEFINEGKNYLVTGVYTTKNIRSSIKPDIIFGSLDEIVNDNLDNWSNYNCALYLKVNDPQKKDVIENTIVDLLIENAHKKRAKEKGITLEEFIKKDLGYLEKFQLFPFSEQHLTDDKYNATLESSVNVQRMSILIVLSIVIFLLSLFNYINFSVVQLLERKKEFGVRKLYGEDSFFSNGFVEGLLITVLSFLLSLVIVEFSLPFLRVFLKSDLNSPSFLDLSLLIILLTVLISSIRGLVFIVMTNTSIYSLLKGASKNKTVREHLKKAILIVQFIIAFFFISSSYTINKQVNFMLDKDLGFKGDQIISVRYLSKGDSNKKLAEYNEIKNRFNSIKGVESISVGTLGIGNGSYNSSQLSYQGNFVQTMNVAIDYNYLDMLGINLKEGRQLLPTLSSDSIKNVLVNEQLISLLEKEEMLGKLVEWNDQYFEIVGIVENYHTRDLKESIVPMIFFSLKTFPWLSNNMNEILIKIDTDQLTTTLNEIESEYSKLNISDFPFYYEFIDKRFEKLFEENISERKVFVFLTTIAICISLFGLYAVSSFTMGTQLKEIAIRKILGADTFRMLRNLSYQYIVLCIIGFCLAIYPTYYFLNEWLSNFAFRISLGWEVFVLSFLIMMVLTLVITISRAYKATKVDILKYIKYE